MDSEAAAQRIKALSRELERHNRLYYEKDMPEIPYDHPGRRLCRRPHAKFGPKWQVEWDKGRRYYHEAL